jgi:hypothetical protein
MEGGIRTPCMIRWPGRIPPGQVSNELVHEVDLFPTIAAAVGAPEIVPDDRWIDGVDQMPFLEGRQARSNRDHVLFVAREGHVMAAKWRDWKLWYLFRTELEPDADDLVKLFDLRVDPREEIDVKDHYPWVIGVVDSLVAEYEASLVVHPRVPGGVDDPYVPPPTGSGDPVETWRRTDRAPLGPRSEALPGPDFSGAWSTAALSATPPTGSLPPPPVPTLGSGWGDRISIVHDPDRLIVERVFFTPREIQPTVRYRYAMDGSETENAVDMGRTGPPPTSIARWDGDQLVLTTRVPFQHPDDGRWLASELVQTLWLEAVSGPPFEPRLVVETTRGAVLGGRPSTNRTVYVKGYR